MISKVQNLRAPPACKPQKLIEVSLETDQVNRWHSTIFNIEQKELAANHRGMKDYLFIDLPFLKVVNPVPQQHAFVCNPSERSLKNRKTQAWC